MERARAGVDVRILVPGNHTDAKPVSRPDRATTRSCWRRAFGSSSTSLDDARQERRGGRCWTIVGSANMDERTMELNEENVLGIADGRVRPRHRRGGRAGPDAVAEVRLDAWRRRPAYQRVLEKVRRVLIEQY